MAYHSFEDLEVWQDACRIATEIYLALKDCSDYGLKNQMTRAAVSIASNIAEGAERGSNPDFIRFLHIAKGSSAELRTQLIIGDRVGMIDSGLSNELLLELKKMSARLQPLISALQKSA